MGNLFRNTGFIILGLVVAAHLGKAIYPDQTFWDIALTPNNIYLAYAGAAVLLGLWFLTLIVNPMGKAVKSNRCARCGKKIPKGDIYCADHLKQVVQEYRDQNR